MSQDPWARVEAQNNRQNNEQTGSGTGPIQPEPPLPPTGTQGELPPQLVQERQMMAPLPNREAPVQQEYPAGATYAPRNPEQMQSALQQSWAPQYGTSTGGYGQSVPVTQYEAEGAMAALVLRQIDESPPQVRLVFALLEQYTGVNRAYIGMGMHYFLSRM